MTAVSDQVSVTDSRLQVAKGILGDLQAICADPDKPVYLGELVQAHRLSLLDELRSDAERATATLTARYQVTHGRIHHDYFCRQLPGGCVIAGPPEKAVKNEPPVTFETVLSSDDPRLIAIETRCNQVFQGVALSVKDEKKYFQHLWLTGLTLFSVMTRVLAAAEHVKQGADAKKISTAIATAEAEFATAKHHAEVILQRWARSIYLQGVLLGVLATCAALAGVSELTARYWPTLYSNSAITMAGVFAALGATVSVIQRMSSGKLVLDVTADGSTIRTIALLRPAVGAVFGVVGAFLLAAGIIGTSTANQSLGLFAVAGFASGFSERFAVDMVERAGRVLFGDPTKTQSDERSTGSGGLTPALTTSEPAATATNSSTTADAGSPAEPTAFELHVRDGKLELVQLHPPAPDEGK